MKSSTLAQLLSAQFDLQRTRLQVQQASLNCGLALMQSQIAAESTRLAAVRCQEEQVKLAIALAQFSSPSLQLDR